MDMGKTEYCNLDNCNLFYRLLDQLYHDVVMQIGLFLKQQELA